MNITNEQQSTLIKALIAIAALLSLVLIGVLLRVSSGPSNEDRNRVKSFLVSVCCQTAVVSKVAERYSAISGGLRSGNLTNAKLANEAVASIIRNEAASRGIPKELLIRVAEPGGRSRHEYASEVAEAVLTACPQRNFEKHTVKRAARAILKMIDWKLFKFE